MKADSQQNNASKTKPKAFISLAHEAPYSITEMLCMKPYLMGFFSSTKIFQVVVLRTCNE